ncbi:MAG TPA: hypothetical protein VFC07_08865 [Verrucomicrobiae bacterium]|nr:hypothetical protein [Verrucomicrobiae bacterium]
MQTEHDFFAASGLPEQPAARKIAEAVRKTIAQLGNISPASISTANVFEDLDWTPFWKKCGDVGFETDALARKLEANLGLKLDKAQLERIRDPDLNVRMTIGEFVQDVWQALQMTPGTQ